MRTAPSLTVFSGAKLVTPFSQKIPGIGQSIPIVAETEQIVDHRNWCLRSRARISDGSARRFFVVRWKNCGVKSASYDSSEPSSGSEGQ
jgi:hypothetical protein